MALSKAQQSYLTEVQTVLTKIESQAEQFEAVCDKIYQSLNSGGVLHVFGSGHSVNLVFELFHRAGGLAAVNPIFDDGLMPSKGPRYVGPTERLSGYAKVIFDTQDLRKGEVVLIASNSGINSVVVEFAELCKSKGLITCAITSLTHSKSVPARGKQKLYEVCDFVLDTGTPVGDACVEIKGLDVKVAPLSSVSTIVIGELLVTRVAEIFQNAGQTAPVLKSANTPGGDEFNKKIESQFRSRIPLL